MDAGLADLLERVTKARGPDAGIDAEIHNRFPPSWLRLRGRNRKENIGQYTASVDVALAFHNQQLPGWLYQIGSCSVSDDARVCPDFNHPVYGATFQAKFNDAFGGRDPAEVIMEATDVARNPPGYLALTLLEATLRGMILQQGRKLRQPTDNFISRNYWRLYNTGEWSLRGEDKQGRETLLPWSLRYHRRGVSGLSKRAPRCSS